MTYKHPQPKKPDPVAGIHKGDSVYFKGRQDMATRGDVIACGKDGFMAKCDAGRHYKVTWDRYVAHHKRVPLTGTVMHEGEDGNLLKMANGRTAFLDTREEAPMRKAMVLFFGRQSGKSLLKSHVKQYTRQDGTLVKEHEDSRVAQVRPVKAPAYPAKQEGEHDKGYLKRIKDHLPDPDHMPEEHDRYFNTAGSTKVPIENLVSSKSDEENEKGGNNSPKFMMAAYHNQVAKRDPITVTPHETQPGKYRVVDGNGTYTGVKKHGWKHLPVNVVSNEKAARLEREDRASEDRKTATKAGEPVLTSEEMAKYPAASHQPFDSWDEAAAKVDESQGQLRNAMNRVASALGLEMWKGSPESVPAERWKDPKGLAFLGPPKTQTRATEKVNGDYGGDWGKLKDLVRGTISVNNMGELRKAIQVAQEAGMTFAERPKDKFAKPTNEGYRDFKAIMRLPNGVLAEMQFHLKAMTMAKNEGHHHYQTTRTLQTKYNVPEGHDPDDAWSDEDHSSYYHSLGEQRRLYGSAHRQSGA